MPVNVISEHLQKFGFSSYESRAYVALLKKSPVTGYELAKNSGVPPSKIYEVIQKLLDKSVISPVHSDPVKYVPQDIDVLLKKLQENLSGSINTLKKHLPRAKNGASQYIWDIKSRQALLNKARELILSSKREILLYCWDVELEALLPQLEKRKNRKIAVVQYGNVALDFGTVYFHEIQEEKKQEKGGREFTLVTDDSDLVQAIISEARTHIGIWTTNESLVGVAKDFIRHDIYAWKLIDRLGPAVEKEFGKDYKRLRDIYSK